MLRRRGLRFDRGLVARSDADRSPHVVSNGRPGANAPAAAGWSALHITCSNVSRSRGITGNEITPERAAVPASVRTQVQAPNPKSRPTVRTNGRAERIAALAGKTRPVTRCIPPSPTPISGHIGDTLARRGWELGDAGRPKIRDFQPLATDNEKTVTVEHVCGIAVRNATIVEVSRHYGLTIATCEPADPQSKGGSEATVQVAKADLVPTDHNLREQYADWQALEQACQEFMADVNTRPHRATRQPPVFLLAQEHEHLHRLPRAAAHAVLRADPQGRPPSDRRRSAMRSTRSRTQLIGERVWVRAEGEQLVVVHIDALPGAAGGRPPPADHAGASEHQRRALPAAAGGCAGAQAPGPQQRGAGVPCRSATAPSGG